MATRKISLPDELASRMDASPRNWSKISRHAIELELRSTTITGEDDMDAIIERLRASKEKSEAEKRPIWIKSGSDWAKKFAEYNELERVAELGLLCEASPDAFGEAQGLAEALGHAELGRTATASELENLALRLTGNPARFPSLSQLGWYLQGTLEVWRVVQPALSPASAPKPAEARPYPGLSDQFLSPKATFGGRLSSILKTFAETRDPDHPRIAAFRRALQDGVISPPTEPLTPRQATQLANLGIKFDE